MKKYYVSMVQDKLVKLILFVSWQKVGEVDYLIDNYDSLNVLPIEIISGKDYNCFRALPKLLNNPNYKMPYGLVFSNNREIRIEDKIIYLPIYFIMFV